MSNYRDQNFAQRFSTMGDTAEDVFEKKAPLGNCTRFGFRRPKGIKFSNIPAFFRHTPDFITSNYLVEVMGLGRDGILKSMKVPKYEALKEWNKIAIRGGLVGVALFLWNSSERQYVVLPWQVIVDEVAYSKKKHGVQSFPNDGNQYYRLDWDRLTAKAQLIGTYEDE